jgi:hypothetical protein
MKRQATGKDIKDIYFKAGRRIGGRIRAFRKSNAFSQRSHRSRASYRRSRALSDAGGLDGSQDGRLSDFIRRTRSTQQSWARTSRPNFRRIQKGGRRGFLSPVPKRNMLTTYKEQFKTSGPDWTQLYYEGYGKSANKFK